MISLAAHCDMYSLQHREDRKKPLFPATGQVAVSWMLIGAPDLEAIENDQRSDATVHKETVHETSYICFSYVTLGFLQAQRKFESTCGL